MTAGKPALPSSATPDRSPRKNWKKRKWKDMRRTRSLEKPVWNSIWKKILNSEAPSILAASRRSSGICCAIRIPEKDTMVNILKKKIEINKLDVDLFDDDALNYLASKNSHNVRELEGALSRLIFYITLNSLYGERITLNVVREAFEDTQPISLSTSKTEKSVTMEDITYQVACHFNLTLAQIKSKVRTMQIAYARQIAVYLIRKILGSPYNEIGKFFDRDHSTIISSCNKINGLLSKDENLKKTVEELHRKLK